MAELIDSFVSNPWLVLATSIVLSAAAAWFIARLSIRILERAIQPQSGFGAVLKASRTAIAPALMCIAMLTAAHSAPDDLSNIEPIRRLLGLLLILTLAVLASRAINGLGDAIVLSNPYDIEDNYRARGILTQSRVLTRTLSSITVIVGLAAGLMVFPKLREFGTGLLASAGILGVAVGLAAKPMIGNLLAGLQIAFTQPIRIDDVVIVEGEWGRIEEIGRTYVVIKIWYERRLIVPFQYFIEHPFENWTRGSANILGTVFLWTDYGIPVDRLRDELKRLCETDLDWDRRVAILQVTDTNERGVQLRVLVSSSNSSRNFDLRCRLREGLLGFIREQLPEFLPTLRASLPREGTPSSVEQTMARAA